MAMVMAVDTAALAARLTTESGKNTLAVIAPAKSVNVVTAAAWKFVNICKSNAWRSAPAGAARPNSKVTAPIVAKPAGARLKTVNAVAAGIVTPTPVVAVSNRTKKVDPALAAVAVMVAMAEAGVAVADLADPNRRA